MRRIGPGRAARARGALAVCGVLALSACAAKYVQVPPRLDLEPYGRIALITFSAEQANPGLGTLATQRFAEAVLASQSGIELLELGPADSALGEPGAEGDAGAFARALGRERDVPAVFVGHLSLSGIKPRGRLSASRGMSVRAGVSAELTVRLVSTRTGATVWRSSAVADRTVGSLAISERPAVAVRDPEEAYGEVVRELVVGVTRDLRPTWVKR